MSAITVNEVRPGFYLDSVALMRVAARIRALEDVVEAALMVGTPANIEILAKADLLNDNGKTARANDLIIAVRATSNAAASQALAKAAAALEERRSPRNRDERCRPHSITAATHLLADANLALVSVPGAYAAAEARKALRAGLHVMIFSDNVPLEQERALKQEAHSRGLLVMGPDCGTAIVAGTALAFANAVPRGRIGIIAASGTGMQEVSVLAAHMGEGLSHGLGVGSRDLSEEVGGLSTLTAIELLEQNPETELMLVISKPPGLATARRVGERLGECRKPAVLCLLGHERPAWLPDRVGFTATLRDAAELLTGKPVDPCYQPPPLRLRRGRRWLRGLFAGGSLCAEAQTVARRAGMDFASNVPIPGGRNGAGDRCHCLLDLGADEFTVGRPHPMIEPTLRNELLAAALRDKDVAAVLIDVILGFGAHPDPAGGIASVLASAPGDRPLVLTSLCGVQGDPQNYAAQLATLRAAGVVVTPSNAHASELAVAAVNNQG